MAQQYQDADSAVEAAKNLINTVFQQFIDACQNNREVPNSERNADEITGEEDEGKIFCCINNANSSSAMRLDHRTNISTCLNTTMRGTQLLIRLFDVVHANESPPERDVGQKRPHDNNDAEEEQDQQPKKSKQSDQNVKNTTANVEETKFKIPRRKKQKNSSSSGVAGSSFRMKLRNRNKEKSKPEPKGEVTKPKNFCRCGTTTTPGKITCRGQRCPCYKVQVSCENCNCIGCNNPYKNTDETPPSPKKQEKVPSGESVTTLTNHRNFNRDLIASTPLEWAAYLPVLVPLGDGNYQIVRLYDKSYRPIDPATLGLERIQIQTANNPGVTFTVFLADEKNVDIVSGVDVDVGYMHNIGSDTAIVPQKTML